MDNDAQFLLDDTIAFCQRDGRDGRLISMLRQSIPTQLTEDELTIQVPSRFAYSYMEKQSALVEAYLEEIAFAPIKLKIEVAGASGQAAPMRQTAGAQTTPTIQAVETPEQTPRASRVGSASDVPAEPSMGPAASMGGVTAATPQAATVPPAAAAPAAAPSPLAGAPKQINVKNTVSPDAYRRMMEEMRAESTMRQQPPSAAVANSSMEQSVGAATSTQSATGMQEETYPAVEINSKFTFENFVFGDENKHAYQSSLRFAAFADEPGQCTSLFIYGNSGLGKTHLLFAIKNYLAQEKPYLQVKYANSQAYLDDYMRELGSQHGPGELIMREYRDADILIIDDIQNIVGKQASVEFFFQLVDGFIRENKKIVIASDRAPKRLGLDERLTSRFNAGMLCLVSEPGFEMKYAILKRYYENIIMGSGDLANMSVDTSLLSAIQVREGHLTDEQLRHMAEISGNNIRELESFCERCAGVSSEREQEGAELTAEDIERIADEYFDTAHKIIHIDTVQNVVEEYYHVSHEELIGPRRTANIAFARHVAVYLANNLCEMTTPAIGAEFGGRDHSTVLNSLKVVENKMKEDRRICEELQQLKNKILLKS